MKLFDLLKVDSSKVCCNYALIKSSRIELKKKTTKDLNDIYHFRKINDGLNERQEDCDPSAGLRCSKENTLKETIDHYEYRTTVLTDYIYILLS